jgi:hypothetical protein
MWTEPLALVLLFQNQNNRQNSVAYRDPGTVQAKGFCRLAASV